MFFCECVQEKQDGQSSAFTYREGRAQQGGGREEEKASKAGEQRRERRSEKM